MQLSGNANKGKTAYSDDESVCVELDNLHMTDVAYKYESSVCSSSDDESVSDRLSPVQDDANSEFHMICKKHKMPLQSKQCFIRFLNSFPNGSDRLVGARFQR